MVVVGIIGILAAIAMPLYNGYTIRSKVTEGILALSQCRQSVSELYQMADSTEPSPGSDNWSCGESTTKTQYVSSVTTNVNGHVLVIFKSLGGAVLEGKTVVMIPTVDDSEADWPTHRGHHVNGWTCEPGGPDPLDNTYVPHSCR
jgi:type IV pilus assembly protein PilA